MLACEQYPSMAFSRRQASVPGLKSLWFLSSHSVVPGFRFSRTIGLSAADAVPVTAATRRARAPDAIGLMVAPSGGMTTGPTVNDPAAQVNERGGCEPRG